MAEGRAGVERLQQACLLPAEPVDGRLAGRAVRPRNGEFAQPAGEMRFERRPVGEAMPSDRVALNVAYPALVLALGAGPIRREGLGREIPLASEGVGPLVESHLARLCIVVIGQRPGVVELHLAPHAAEVPERALQPLEPRRLPLVPERLHVSPP